MNATPSYFDYHWSVRPDLDQVHGAGTRTKMTQALLDLRAKMGAGEKKLLELFATDRFIPIENRNYKAIEEVAAIMGVLK